MDYWMDWLQAKDGRGFLHKMNNKHSIGFPYFANSQLDKWHAIHRCRLVQRSLFTLITCIHLEARSPSSINRGTRMYNRKNCLFLFPFPLFKFQIGDYFVLSVIDMLNVFGTSFRLNRRGRFRWATVIESSNFNRRREDCTVHSFRKCNYYAHWPSIDLQVFPCRKKYFNSTIKSTSLVVGCLCFCTMWSRVLDAIVTEWWVTREFPFYNSLKSQFFSLRRHDWSIRSPHNNVQSLQIRTVCPPLSPSFHNSTSHSLSPCCGAKNHSRLSLNAF